jgi:hypothetical protein
MGGGEGIRMKALKRFGWKNIWEDIIWELSAQL